MNNDNANEKQMRIRNLDLYKGIAIILVIFTHYSWSEEDRLRLFFPFWVDMAVPVFMIITGYVVSMSIIRRGGSLFSFYKPTVIISKWLRFIIPYIPAWILTVFARVLGIGGYFSLNGVLIDFFLGDGPGSYYFLVMLQIVLFMPIIVWIIRVKPEGGLLLCFLINTLFEVLKSWINMDPALYRLCSLRYIFLLSYGCYLYFYKRSRRKMMLSFGIGILGIGYIYIFNYTGIEPIITSLWTTTSIFAVLILVPIMMLLIDINVWKCILLEELGKASYNIFLVQMVYYLIINRLGLVFVPFPLLQILVNILVCCLIGVLFYKLENPITRGLVIKINHVRERNAQIS